MIPILLDVQSTTAAVESERIRLDVISENIANAHTTRGPDGRPYQRQAVVFETALQLATGCGERPQTPTLHVGRIEKDPRSPVMVYEPSHPDADANEMVATPALNLHEDMPNMIAASRAFEANLAVIKNARSVALQTLSIGKQ